MEWCLEASEFPGGRSVRGVCAIGSDLAAAKPARERMMLAGGNRTTFPLVVTIKQTGFSTSQLRIDWVKSNHAVEVTFRTHDALQPPGVQLPCLVTTRGLPVTALVSVLLMLTTRLASAPGGCIRFRGLGGDRFSGPCCCIANGWVHRGARPPPAAI